MRSSGAGTDPPSDVRLTWEEMDDLRDEVVRTFGTTSSAQELLRSIGFPREGLDSWSPGVSSDGWWRGLFERLEDGTIDDPYRRLIGAAAERYGHNRVFRELLERHVPEAAARRPETCHVLVRAGDEQERVAAAQVLSDLDLAPDETWSTEYVVCFAVDSADVASARRKLEMTSLGWTLVPPGRAPYLLRELYVQGPDGTRFRLVDAPAQQTFSTIAGEVVSSQYGDDMAAQPAVVDRVVADGTVRRLSADSTLDDAELEDGEQLRIGFEGRAGAIAPWAREEALVRVRNQLLWAAERRDDVEVRADSAIFPTEYEIDFRQASLGPPAGAGGSPVPVLDHTLLVALGVDFPTAPPQVFWQTPIFHPNIFPNYDCEQSRERPHAQGLVCLGTLSDGWYPAVDFGQLLQTLIDMAGYRNYELFEVAAAEGEPGAYAVRANYFDRQAAAWALEHPDEIAAIGGTPRLVIPKPGSYRNVIQQAE